jgi:large conductance mechanosensitive channel
MSRAAKILKEFKEFAVKGNVIDLAVAVIVGGAFTPIVKSLVDDIVMPPIGLLTGGVDFKDKFIQLNHRDHIFATLADAKKALADSNGIHAVTMNIGLFINNVITFLIVSFVVFLLVRALNTLKRPKANAEPVVKDCPACTMSIPIKATRCPHCTSDLGAAHV